MTDQVRPVPRSSYYDEFPGEWLAVHDDTREVLAHSLDSRELVRLVRALPVDQQNKAVIVGRIPRPGEPLFLGWMSL